MPRGKYLPIGRRYSPAAVQSVLAAYHDIHKAGGKPFPLTKEIMKRLPVVVRQEIRRISDINSCISWARSLHKRLQAGVRPMDPLAKNEALLALIPLPLIFENRGPHRSSAAGAVRVRRRVIARPTAKPDLDLIMTTSNGTAEIQIKTDTETARRIVAALEWR